MSQVIRDLVDTAAAGRPVYISSVREQFDDAGALGVVRTARPRLDGFDEAATVFNFRLPRFAPAALTTSGRW